MKLDMENTNDIFVYALFIEDKLVAICNNVESCAVHAYLLGYKDSSFSIRQFILLDYSRMNFDKVLKSEV